MAGEQLSSLVLLITSASCSSAWATCCCSAGASTVLEFAMSVKRIERVASMIAPAKASPNERPNEPPAEFTPAASLTRSSEIGDEGVVVELGDQQPQARPRDQQRDHEVPAGVCPRDDRYQPIRPPARSAKPNLTMLAGRRSPAFLPARSATANMLSDSGAIESPAWRALYSSTICR